MDGTPFGRYRLIELLGGGGMGEVWCAHDADTDRVVALKLLPAHLSGLVRELGFDAVDAGDLAVARLLEPYALLWIHLALRRRFGTEWAFGLLRGQTL